MPKGICLIFSGLQSIAYCNQRSETAQPLWQKKNKGIKEWIIKPTTTRLCQGNGMCKMCCRKACPGARIIESKIVLIFMHGYYMDLGATLEASMMSCSSCRMHWVLPLSPKQWVWKSAWLGQSLGNHGLLVSIYSDWRLMQDNKTLSSTCRHSRHFLLWELLHPIPPFMLLF